MNQYPKEVSGGVMFFDRALGIPFFIPNEELVTCKFCGRYFRFINATHLRTHDTTLREYKRDYEIPFGETPAYAGTLEKFKQSISHMSEETKELARKKAHSLRKIFPVHPEYNAGSLRAMGKNIKIGKLPNMIKRRNNILELLKKKHGILKRRLSKSDFEEEEYRKIFNVFHSLKIACHDAGLPDYPDVRPWRKKSEEHKEAQKIKDKIYQKEWVSKNREKVRALSLKHYYKLKKSPLGREKIRSYAIKRYNLKLKNQKMCDECKEKMIYIYSPRCRSCTMKKRNAAKRDVSESNITIT